MSDLNGHGAAISVVMCTRDRHDIVGQAVQSVAECAWPRFDIHVMDQSAGDQTRQVIENLAARRPDGPRIAYHHLDRAGLSRAYNAGIAACAGEVIAFTDDDVIAPPDWLGSIAQAFAAEPRAGLLYGQVLAPESLANAHERGLVVPALSIERRERLGADAPFRVFGMGANFAVRRSVLGRVGGFDEALGGGGPLRSSQDFDFAFRVWRSGSIILLEPSVKVDHYGTRTLEQWPATMRNYGIGDGGFYFKHVRCRDLFALRLLLGRLVRSWAREAKQSLRQRRWVPDVYGRALLRGVRDSMAFDVDRASRLYRETARARITETQANVVTGARREGTGG